MHHVVKYMSWTRDGNYIFVALAGVLALRTWFWASKPFLGSIIGSYFYITSILKTKTSKNILELKLNTQWIWMVTPILEKLLGIMTFENANLFYSVTNHINKLSQFPLSKHVSPPCGSTNHQSIRSTRSDLGTTNLKGRIATPGSWICMWVLWCTCSSYMCMN